MGNPNLFSELKRRNVLRMAGLYLVGAWLVVQVAGTVLPMFGVPEWLPRTIVVLLVIGFVPAVIFSWVFQLTPQGLKREDDLAPEQSITPQTGHWMDRMIIVVLVLALGYFAFDKFVLAPRREAALGSSVLPKQSKSVINAKSIAVLPFENLSEEKANAFFAEGVQDEILTALSRIADLKVISRASVMQYKSGGPRNLREIGQQLGVARVVEGSVQRAANKVRVNAQLIDARNDAHLWAQTYDRDLADVFAIQSEIAKAIADQLQAKLSPSEKRAIEQRPTSNIAAFELYSRANDLILNIGFSSVQVPNIHAGIDLLNQALARDPSFFAAQCQLARAHDTLYALREHTPEQRALAEAAIKAAFQLRPDAGEAHLARATHLYQAYRDYDGALAELDIVRGTMPNAPGIFELTGYIARRRGAHDEGVRNLEHAVELDPRNFFTLQQLALSFKQLHRYAEEIATLDRALSIKPDDPEAKGARGLAFFDWKADTQTLHQTIDEIRTTNPEALKSVADVWFICALAEHDPAAAEAALGSLGEGRLFGANSTSFDAGFGRAMLGRMRKDQNKARSAFSAIRPEQEKTVQAQPDYGPPVCILALIDAGLGRKEEAEREIRHAVDLVPMEKDRSEERRVGKECRSRWSPYH